MFLLQHLELLFQITQTNWSSAAVWSSSWIPLVTVNASLACLRQRDGMKGYLSSGLGNT